MESPQPCDGPQITTGFCPHPQYPGGRGRTRSEITEQWDFAGTGSGLWPDGVIYNAACYQRADERGGETAVTSVNDEIVLKDEPGAAVKLRWLRAAEVRHPAIQNTCSITMTDDNEAHHYHNGKRKERYNFHESISTSDMAFLRKKQACVDRHLAQFSEPRSPYLWMKTENEEDLFVLWTWGRTAKPFFRITRSELIELE